MKNKNKIIITFFLLVSPMLFFSFSNLYRNSTIEKEAYKIILENKNNINNEIEIELFKGQNNWIKKDGYIFLKFDIDFKEKGFDNKKNLCWMYKCHDLKNGWYLIFQSKYDI